MNILSHSPRACKCSAEEMEEFLGAGKMDYDLSSFNMTGCMRMEMIRQILAGSNEQAVSVMSGVGTLRSIPGIGECSVPMKDFAEFYGVSEKYLQSLLVRSGFIQKNYPDDIIRLSRENIVDKKPPFERYNGQILGEWADSRQEMIRYHIKGTYKGQFIVLPERGKFNLYSPRMVLATSLLMLYTDKSGKDNNITRAIHAIKRSPYRFVKKVEPPPPEEKKEESVKPEVLKPAVAEAEFQTLQGVDGIRFSPGGEFVLPAEVFMRLIQATIKESISSVVAELKTTP